MKPLKFYGASDDLLEISGREQDEIGVYTESDLVGRIDIQDGRDRLRLHVVYDGCWSFAITSPDEEMPPWGIERTYGEDVDYSETVVVHAPESAKWKFTPNRD